MLQFAESDTRESESNRIHTNKMKRLGIAIWIMLVVLGVVSTACIEDNFTTSSSDVLAFSTDTLAFDTILTDVVTPTKQFIVYNRHDKMLNISSIKIAGESNGKFYLNVDGVKGDEFRDVEIRGNDSIFVFVEAFIDPSDENNPIQFEEKLDFVTNGVKQQVVITAWGQNVTRLYSHEVSADEHFTANRPYVVFDTLRVLEGAKLTLEAGTRLYFHDKATMVVDGTLIADGTMQQPIDMRGDRLDKVVGGIGYDIMSGQWNGLRFTESSFGNELRYVNMRGSSTGVVVDSAGVEQRKLHIFNTVLQNSAGSVLTASHAWIEAEGSELSDARRAVALLTGGKFSFVNCTFANYYLFNIIEGPILTLNYLFGTENDGITPLMEANFDNCIFYGNTSDISAGDLTDSAVVLRNCLLKSNGEDDDNFISCVWGGNPKFYTVRNQYIFDYRLHDESDAIGKGNEDYCSVEAAVDRYGVARRHADGTIDIGAYTWVQEKAEE